MARKKNQEGVRVRPNRDGTKTYEAWVVDPREVRHKRACASHEGRACDCTPYYVKIRRSFPTLAAARGWRQDACGLVRKKQLRASQPITLREEVEAWLTGAQSGAIRNRREQPYKPSVIRNYKISLEKRVLPELGHMRLDAISRSDVMQLKEELQASGIADSTIRNTFVPLQAIFRRARDHERLMIDPMMGLRLPTAPTRDRVATPEQAAALLAPLAEREQGVWACAFYSGLRRGEMRALRVRAVDLDAGTIDVKHGWDGGEIAPKSKAGVRVVFVAEALRPYLEPLVEGRPAEAFVFGSDLAPFEPRAIDRKASRAWNAADQRRAENKEAPLVRFTLHEGRHSFSTWCDHAGISRDRRSVYMGHATGDIDSHYSHLLVQQRPKDRTTFDAYLSGEPSEVVALTA
jgi:integrase